MCLISVTSDFGNGSPESRSASRTLSSIMRHGQHHVAEQLAFVGVGDVAVVGELVDLGRVVQERADQQLVLIELRVARRDDAAPTPSG